MPLLLKITSHPGQLPDERARSFDVAQIAVGRALDNDWALPDPDRHLSNHHCVIRRDGSQYSITDLSTNGVFINGAAHPIGKGATAPLRHGDRIAIGNYELVAEIASSAADPLAQVPAARPRDRAEGPFGVAPAAPIPVARPSLSPFETADPLGPFEGRAGMGSPFAAPDEPAAPARPPAFPDGIDWLLGDRAPLAPPPVERSFEHIAPERAYFEPASRFAEPLGAAENTSTHPMPDEAVGPTAAPFPGGAEMASAAATPARSDPVEPTADGKALIEAFRAAAGLAPSTQLEDEPQALMRTLGQAFRQIVAGLRELLAARALVKSQYRIEQTIIQSANNNPLKFCDVEQAVANLLTRRRGAYMPGPQAIDEAFRDLKGHELAVIAAMQAALSTMLEDFAPDRLRRRFEEQSASKSLIPGSRRAKYWELYELQYGEMRRAALEEVRSTFGRAFADSYEAHEKKF